MICQVCNKLDGIKGSIIQDVYYGSICTNCYVRLTVIEQPSSGQASYDRGRDTEEHEADIRQPYTEGKPDAGFIHLYPERAKQMFSHEEIDQATRS